MSGDTEVEEMQIKSVYHSVDSIMRVLKGEQVNALSEVQNLIAIFNACYPEGKKENLSHTVPRKELFIVFEGLDGSGKSTISHEVKKKMHGFKMVTPPKSVSLLRTAFDKQSSVVRRAYYSLGNYIAAKEIEDKCQQKLVVLDRFWHSTAAYALATEFEGQSETALPPEGHPVYKWPDDLLKPDLVLFLDVDEETRRIRHERRQQTTKEEDQLAKDEAFRNLVLAAFNRMHGVPIIHVDSGLSVKQTLYECLGHIKLLKPAT